MTDLIRVENASYSVPVQVSHQRNLKSDIFSLVKNVYLSKMQWEKATLLEDINLNIKTGDRLAIVGHNGAGKTSLLYLLGGNYHPESGKVVRNGRILPIYSLTVGFNNKASGLENIYLRGLLMGMTLKEIGEQREGIILFSELDDHIFKPLSTYSSGMRMRLAFAITMCFSPDVLIMDEWFSVGDKQFQIKAKARLEEFVESSSSLVVATHSEDLVKSLCNRVIVMQGGRIVDDKPVDGNFVMPL